MSRWFGSVDMAGASAAASTVINGLERLLDDTEPAQLQPSRSWIKTKGRGWPPPELVPPDSPPNALPDWVDCELGIRIGHDTEPEADITVGVGSAHAVVGCLGGRMLLAQDNGTVDRPWTDEVFALVEHPLRAQYIWERQYDGARCVRWALVNDGVHVSGRTGPQDAGVPCNQEAATPLPKGLPRRTARRHL